ncbi:hypothetical protein [Salinicola sp. DM10]|uniref:hypothetical protein n=1 Tax=Salinicola sp. DM10 TaxID=2815721 RepID=UPI001A8FF13A|nr:hypothetical protein [Salinicola sp. DM10]
MTFKATLSALLALGTLALTGCASIVGDSNQTIAISSTPSQAHIAIVDETGKQVFEGQTPTTVTLAKSDGSYWGGKDYRLSLDKPGYAPLTLNISSSPNGWYLAGNLVFGGLIGWFVVDPFSGKMYSLSPDAVDATLGTAVSSTSDDGHKLNVVLLEDVPPAQRGNLRYLGQI